MDYLKAFVFGGGLCFIGQVLIDKTKLTPARILVGYVVCGVILSSVGIYEPFLKFADASTYYNENVGKWDEKVNEINQKLG